MKPSIKYEEAKALADRLNGVMYPKDFKKLITESDRAMESLRKKFAGFM